MRTQHARQTETGQALLLTPHTSSLLIHPRTHTASTDGNGSGQHAQPGPTHLPSVTSFFQLMMSRSSCPSLNLVCWYCVRMVSL